MAHDSSIIFITGGVRSGKSRFAEKIAMEMWQSSGSEPASLYCSDATVRFRNGEKN